MNTLESITPVELLMAADIKDITEKEWAEALDACVKDLDAVPTTGAFLSLNMQRVLQRQLDSRTNKDVPRAVVVRTVVADGFARVLRCYVARARKAASHTWARSVDVYATRFPFTSEDIQKVREAYARQFPPLYLDKGPAQQPVIPDKGLCWVKKPNGNWVLYHNAKDGHTWQSYVYSVDVTKRGDVWWVDKIGRAQPHGTLHRAMRSVEENCRTPAVPKPADENTPWIVLTAEGKLELERVVKFEARRIPDPLAALFRDNLADVKGTEGWSWMLNHYGRYDLLYRKESRVVVKGQAWLARMAGIWGVSAPDITSKIIGTQEEAMRALEKHYNLPKLNRP